MTDTTGFHKRFQDLVDLEGLSLFELAKHAGINYQTLKSCMERGTLPSSENLLKISEFFGKSMEYLLTGNNPYATGIYVSGHMVKEESNKFETMKKLADADEAINKEVSYYLDYILERNARLEKEKNAEGKQDDPPHEGRKASNH